MMRTFNPENERQKRRYLHYAKAAKRLSEASLDRIAASIDRFQSLTNLKPFSKFHVEQVIAFRNKLDTENHHRTGKPLSASVRKAVLADCKGFFLWLADQPRYRKRIRYADCEYFNLDNKAKAIANAGRPIRYPSIEQVETVLRAMPFETSIEKRNRAIIAFTVITGARISAIRTACVGSVDVSDHVFNQDARVVKTKFSKTFDTWFFPISGLATEIIIDYMRWIKTEMLFGSDDPLFPKTKVTHVKGKGFQTTGLLREHWANDEAIRKIFRGAFELSGLPYYHPHAFRHTIGAIAKRRCQNDEERQAWAQNLGQESAATMIQHYGKVHADRQREILRRKKKSSS